MIKFLGTSKKEWVEPVVITLAGIVMFGGALWYTRTHDVLTVRDGIAEKAADMISGGFDTSKSLPVLGRAPDVIGIVDWINTDPLGTEDLQGKVVLVDFWTYSCVNCIRTFPFVQGWHEKFKDDDFVLLGVHTPEFEFEKSVDNVRTAAQANGLTYPIALDSNRATWNAFANQYWPAHYLIDVDGNIRYVHFGEGKYAETEAAIRSLLVEAGKLSEDDMKLPKTEEVADRSGVGTPETYLGYQRLEYLGNATGETTGDVPFVFVRPERIDLNRFYFDGEWVIGPESSTFVGDEGSISIRYSARRVNLVFGEADTSQSVSLLLDGRPLSPAEAGDDVVFEDGEAVVSIDGARLYNLVSDVESGEHTLEIKTSDPGVETFAFTFG